MNKLKQSLGLWAAVAMVMGVIGSGIFMKPATMAGQLGSPELLILVWIGAGIVTLFGALSIAEVTAMLPETGGLYVFFQKMYGEFFAFLYAWSAFAVFNTAGTASVAYIMSTYVEYFVQLPTLTPEIEKSVDLYLPFIGHIFPLENIGVKLLTVTIVVLLTYVSYRSTKSGGRLMVLLTFSKIGALVLVGLAVLFSGQGSVSNFFTDSAIINPQGWALAGAIVAATSGAFWAYDGWMNVTFIAGEIKEPKRNIPRSLIVGTILVIFVYVLINLAYLYVMPVDQMAGSSMVASDSAKVIMGAFGGGLIALLVILSTLGCTQSNILSTTRVTFAMAAQGNFFKKIGEVHPRYGTPGNALWLHGIWTSALVFSGSFDTLTDMVIFISWIFYGMSALGVFVLRYKMPLAERPYKVWGYPFIPAIFVAVTLFFLAMTLYTDITNYNNGKTVFINSVMGIFLTGIGIPLYWYFRRK
jgi:basic amino acid/polyamine antiporter, APA family